MCTKRDIEFIIVPDGRLVPGSLGLAFVSDLGKRNWTYITCPVCKEEIKGRLLGHLMDSHGVEHPFFTVPMTCMCGAEFITMKALYEHLGEMGEQCIISYLMGQ
jgi:hypothetical protein